MIRKIARYTALRKDASRQSTKVTPLSEIKNAFVLLDCNTYDCAATEDRIREFFSEKGIRTVIYQPLPTTVNWYGKPKDEFILKLKNVEKGIFISLSPNNDFTVKYCAVCSGALCKVGRIQIKPRVLDIVITGNDSSQIKVFEHMARLLEQIQ